MAELIIKQDERMGIMKEIDEGAMDMIFEAMQSDIYSFPIKSFIRETISNALDSTKEKNIRKAIQGGEPISNYYLDRSDDKLLKDSSFDADYCSPEHLGEEDLVKVIYQQGTPRDKITIKDTGVGLGKTRLRGITSLGFSTKRNMKNLIGKFGAGSKSALATNVDYFTITTYFEGFSTTLMIFAHDYEPITPASENSIEEIWDVTMADGSKASKILNWEPTSEPNGVEFSVEVKKHNRQEYLNAITEQFYYFDKQIEVKELYEDGDIYSSEVISTTKLYESDTLAIPEYSQYYKPHVLVDGICYGVISWAELELEDRRGKMAIKVRATDVDITQSRESLKWTEKTKSTILRAVKTAEKEAALYVSEKAANTTENEISILVDSSFIGESGDSVVRTFREFLNTGTIEASVDIPTSSGVETITTSPTCVADIFQDFVVKRLTFSGTKLYSFQNASPKEFSEAIKIYSTDKPLGPKLASRIIEHEEGREIVYIRPSTDISDEVKFKFVEEKFLELIDYNLTDGVKSEDLEDLGSTFEEEEEVKRETTVRDREPTPAELRRLNNKSLLSEYRVGFGRWRKVDFSVFKHEYTNSQLRDFCRDNDVVVYPSSMRELAKSCALLDTTGTKYMLVNSQILSKCVAYGATPITSFLLSAKEGQLVVPEFVKNLARALKIRAILDRSEPCVKLNTLTPAYRTFSSLFDRLAFTIKGVSGLDEGKLSYLYLEKFISTLREFSMYDRRQIGGEIRGTYADSLSDVNYEIIGFAYSLCRLFEADEEDKSRLSKELFNSDISLSLDLWDTKSMEELQDSIEGMRSIASIIANSTHDASMEEVELLKVLIKSIKQ